MYRFYRYDIKDNQKVGQGAKKRAQHREDAMLFFTIGSVVMPVQTLDLTLKRLLLLKRIHPLGIHQPHERLHVLR
jgi:hypothetical protein